MPPGDKCSRGAADAAAWAGGRVAGYTRSRMDGSGGARTHRPTPFARRVIRSAVRARATSPRILLYQRWYHI